jgi:uncharacterized circularly permuted ATP-grasp superfamily protein
VNSSQGGGSKDTWVLREGELGGDLNDEVRQELSVLASGLAAGGVGREKTS